MVALDAWPRRSDPILGYTPALNDSAASVPEVVQPDPGHVGCAPLLSK